MKLYATTTSERASKSQGGNNYLNINVLDKEKKIALRLHISTVETENDEPIVAIWCRGKLYQMESETSIEVMQNNPLKAEKKKADN